MADLNKDIRIKQLYNALYDKETIIPGVLVFIFCLIQLNIDATNHCGRVALIKFTIPKNSLK